jgi:hypothetical protein
MRSFDIERPDQARLKMARLEIEAICRKHDLASIVLLHTPGMTEFFYDLQPSYSCVELIEARRQVKTSIHRFDTASQRQACEATANMTHSMAVSMARAATMFLDVSEAVDAVLGTTHGDPYFVQDPTERNKQ